MNKKILYIFRGNTQKRILDQRKEKGPYDFLYGFNHLKNFFDCSYIIAPRGKRLRLIEKLLFIIEKPFSVFTKLGLPLEIYPIFKKKLKRADIIFCVNETIGFGILFYKMLRLIKGKVMVLVMSLPERLKYFRHNRLLIWFISKLLSYADILLTLSDYAQKPLVEIFKVPLGKQETFYFGVDVNYWKLNSNIKRKRFVLSVGNDMNRDYATLVQAIPEDLDLIIVTSKKVDTRGKSNIKILSDIPDSQLRQLYQSSIITVIPSTKLEYESSGLSCILQAMACGSPVLISNIPTIKELFKENVHCLFYNAEDVNSLKNKLLKLIKSKQYRMILSSNSLKLVRERYTIESMKNQIKAKISIELGKK